MAKKKKKGSGLGGSYVMIVVCLLCSCFAILGLMGKLDTYEESENSYADLQQAALTTIEDDETGATGEDAASPMRTISPQELLAAKESGEMEYSSGDAEADVP